MFILNARICTMLLVTSVWYQSLFPTNLSVFIQQHAEPTDANIEAFVRHYLVEREDLQEGMELLDVWCDVVHAVAELVTQKMSQLSIDTSQEDYYHVALKIPCNRYIEACFAAEKNEPLTKTELTEFFLQVFEDLYADDPSRIRRSFAELTSVFCDEKIRPAHRIFYKAISYYARQVGCKKLILDIMDTYKDNFEFDIHQTTSGNNLVFE